MSCTIRALFPAVLAIDTQTALQATLLTDTCASEMAPASVLSSDHFYLAWIWRLFAKVQELEAFR